MSTTHLNIREGNNEWIRDQIDNGEFESIAEAVNYCIRAQRQRELAKGGAE